MRFRFCGCFHAVGHIAHGVSNNRPGRRDAESTSSHKFPKMSPGRVTLFDIVVVYSNIRLRTGSKTAVYDCLLKFVTCHTRDVPRARAIE